MKSWIWMTCAALMIGGCDAMNNNGGSDSGGNDSASGHADHAQTMNMAETRTAVANIAPSEAATTQPTNNDVTGTVTFTQADDGGVHIVADLSGLEPNTEHGFHIHEKGDLSAPDLTSAGGHFNPEGHHHGAPKSGAHAGDLGNVKADASGNAHKEMTVDNITLGDGPNSIIGRAVIVHGKADDLKSDPAGNAGPRIAGGVIEMKQ